MSELQGRIEADQKQAMKSRQAVRLSTLRLLSSEMKNKRIELGRDLTDEDVIDVLSRARKQRLESEEQYRAGDRQDLADREAEEAAVIQEYLPEPLSDSELDAMIEDAIAEVGATSMKEMGAVMGRLMPHLKGRADGGEVSRKVKHRLS